MGSGTKHIAVIDDSEGDFILLREYLDLEAPGRYRCEHFPDYEGFADWLAIGAPPPALVLFDCDERGDDGLGNLQALVERLPTTPVIGMGDQLMGVASRGALKTGISNFICKDDVTPARFVHAVAYACANGDRLRNLFERAYYDSLTGLANRGLLFDRIGHALDRSMRSGEHAALLMVDLDGFKRINDSFGHDCGDALLRAVAQLLQDTVRDSDTVARLGGDEFAILLEGLRHPESAVQIASKILEVAAAPIRIDATELSPSMSIGVSLFQPETSRFTVEWLCKSADIALYRAKTQGKNRYCVFTDELDQQMVDSLGMEQAIRRGFERDEWRVHYQPIVSSDHLEVVGLEALLRWQHPSHGLMLPGHFLASLEKLGFMQQVGEFVFRESVRRFAGWRPHLGEHVVLHVNLSVAQLTSNGFADFVAHELAAAGLQAGSVCLELTESLLFDHSASIVQELSSLASLGVKFAIDDFGTGYGSYNYLKDFHIDAIKIDKRFVDTLASDPTDRAIVRSIMSLAGELGVSVTAEGVETMEQVRQLRRLGNSQLQGFLFHKPLTAAHMTRLALDTAGTATSTPADVSPGSCAAV